jgi:proteasome assembly chaperone (PAC2) family protein
MNQAITFYQEPRLEKPELVAAWPGIGNIGIIALSTLREALQAELFAEIEPWRFSYPHALSIKDGELESLRFPESKFYFKRTGTKDLLLFIGGEQPSEVMKGYEMTNLVLDVALNLGCQRVYTAAAAVAPIHHTLRPRVWAVPNRQELVAETRRYRNTILMGDIEGRGGQGTITGLNGLLLGLAKVRDLPGICLLGEIPVYISQFPVPYPKASKSILEVLTDNLGLTIDLSSLDDQAQEVERNIERFYHLIPEEIRERIEQLKHVSYIKEEKPGTITEEDKKRIMQEVEEFFKKRGKQD